MITPADRERLQKLADEAAARVVRSVKKESIEAEAYDRQLQNRRRHASKIVAARKRSTEDQTE